MSVSPRGGMSVTRHPRKSASWPHSSGLKLEAAATGPSRRLAHDALVESGHSMQVRDHSITIFPRSATCFHFACSAFRKAEKACGPSSSGVVACSSKRARMAGSRMASPKAS